MIWLEGCTAGVPHSPENEHAFDLSAFLKAVRGHRDRFAFLAGGESLNVMIQRAVKRGKTRPQDRAAFAQRAKELLALGALGFGELTAEHFSMSERHIYESAPPDHPLFLLLADIAARHRVPIDIHMEALPEDLPKPARLTSSRNPPVFKANIAAFERLLAHNRKAAIIWSHAGWDNSGQRTRRLMRALLGRHPNPYTSLQVGGDSLGETAERLRWLLTACLNTDRREFHPAQVEITLVFSPDKHLDDCCG